MVLYVRRIYSSQTFYHAVTSEVLQEKPLDLEKIAQHLFQCGQGLATMTDPVLFLEGELGQGLVQLGDDKEGIIPEPHGSAFFFPD